MCELSDELRAFILAVKRGALVDDRAIAKQASKAADELDARAATIEALEGTVLRILKEQMDFNIMRYLLSNIRRDGAEKAECHSNLVDFFLSAFRPKQRHNIELQTFVHDWSQTLTSHLDEEIGFKLFEEHQDLRKLGAKFFTRFVELCHEALTAFDTLADKGEPLSHIYWLNTYAKEPTQ